MSSNSLWCQLYSSSWFDQKLEMKNIYFSMFHKYSYFLFSAFVKSHSVELAWRSLGAELKLIQGATRSTIQPITRSTSSSSSSYSSAGTETEGNGLLVQWRLASNQLTSDWWVSYLCHGFRTFSMAFPALGQQINPCRSIFATWSKMKNNIYLICYGMAMASMV